MLPARSSVICWILDSSSDMENTGKVFYFDGQAARPRPARLLLFDHHLHLYETDADHLIASFSYKDLHLLSKDNSYAHFRLGDDALALDIPLDNFLLPELLKQKDATLVGFERKLSGLKLPLLVLISFGLIAGLYFLLVSGLSGFALQFISPKKEAELGRIIYSNIVESSTIDSAATALLTKFAGDLKLSDKYTLKYTVLDEPEINAFAIPGGHIVVYKGILQKMESPEELVALLGHESTHVNERPSLKNILQSMTGGIILSTVFGDLGSFGSVFAEKANTLQSLSYSRGLEEEADEKGMAKMLDNQVDPIGMVKLMDRLDAVEKGVQLPGFLSSHPLTRERRGNALKFVRDHAFVGKLPVTVKRDWEALKAETGNELPSAKKSAEGSAY